MAIECSLGDSVTKFRKKINNMKKPLFGLASILLALGFITLAPQTAMADDDIYQVLQDTNNQRAAAGLPPVVLDSRLSSVAQNWAYQMVHNNNFAHNPNVGGQIPGGYTRFAENIAAGYYASEVVPAWMTSPGHRAAILNPVFTHMGVGVLDGIKAQSSGRWWVQVFAAYPVAPVAPPVTTTPAPVDPPAPPTPVSPVPESTVIPVAPTVEPAEVAEEEADFEVAEAIKEIEELEEVESIVSPPSNTNTVSKKKFGDKKQRALILDTATDNTPSNLIWPATILAALGLITAYVLLHLQRRTNRVKS